MAVASSALSMAPSQVRPLYLHSSTIGKQTGEAVATTHAHALNFSAVQLRANISVGNFPAETQEVDMHGAGRIINTEYDARAERLIVRFESGREFIVDHVPASAAAPQFVEAIEQG
ncbi:MAG: hypothetical protein ABIO49_05075 [Dokdonella sp.]